MALSPIPVVRTVFCIFLLVFCSGMVEAGEQNPEKLHVEGPPVRLLRFDRAEFRVVGDSRSFVHLWIDGSKVLARSFAGKNRIRLVLDRLPAGWHTVTFRLARADQYEYGNEVDVRVHVPDPGKSLSSGPSGRKSGVQ